MTVLHHFQKNKQNNFILCEIYDIYMHINTYKNYFFYKCEYDVLLFVYEFLKKVIK